MTEFSFKTVDNFDRHIEVSVPNYLHIHDLILSMSCYFISKGCTVNDLGCSSGLLIDKLDQYHKDPTITYNGYEIEENIVKKEYFHDNRHIHLADVLTTEFPNNSLTFSVFLLQFLPLEARKRLVERVYASLEEGGAFIVTEKTYEPTGRVQDIFTFSYYDLKLKVFTGDEILEKQKTLRKIQKPLTREENEKMFTEAGFTVSEFYRSLNFCGWLCLK